MSLAELERQITELHATLKLMRSENNQRVTIQQIEEQIAYMTAQKNSITEPSDLYTESHTYKEPSDLYTKIIDCGGGGDCFYRCIAEFIYGNSEEFHQVRNDMYTWFGAHREYFGHEMFKDLKILDKGKWIEGEYEILIAVNTYKINITVLTDKDNIHYFHFNYIKTCCLYNKNQMHYQLICDDS